MTFFEFRGDILRSDAQLDHEDVEMIEKVGDLKDGLLAAAAFAGDDDFGALLAYFFRILSMPFSKR